MWGLGWSTVLKLLRSQMLWLPLLSFGLVVGVFAYAYRDGYKKGVAKERQAWAERLGRAETAAARTSLELQLIANQQARAYEQRIDDIERRSRNGMVKLQDELQKLRGVCRVPTGVIRVFNDTTHPNLPRTAAAAAEPGEPAAGVDAAAFVEHTYRNYTEVCLPNAEQLRGVQEFYEQVRARHNKK